MHEDRRILPLGGGWYRLPNNEKVRGRDNAQARLEKLLSSTYGLVVKTSEAQPPTDLSAKPPALLQAAPIQRTRYPSVDGVKRPAVAILGFTDTRMLAPFNDPRFEIWGLNELYRYMDIVKHGFTRWFEIHERKVIDPDKSHVEALGKFPVPVYMQQHYDDIGPSIEYPKQAVEVECGKHALMWPDGCKYFTSSIAWMLGLALLEGFEEIHVYGVDMAQEVEYFEQRNACEYFIGMAQGRGVKVYVPPTADLLKAVGQYGWAGDSEFRLKLEERFGWLTNQENQYKTRLGQLDNERAQIIANLNQIGGAKQDVTFWKRSWSTPVASDGANPHRDREQPLDGKANLQLLDDVEASLTQRNVEQAKKAEAKK